MFNALNSLGAASFRHFADWTDRIAAGELPQARPPRPQGVERNVVLTLWDWGDQKTYLHDLIATDRRKPTVNANGKIYGAHENSSDLVPVLDPVTHTASSLPHPLLDPKTRDPIIAAMQTSDEPPLYRYEPGYWGPEESSQWIARQNRQWFDTCPVLH
jgi:hypothetical protein